MRWYSSLLLFALAGCAVPYVPPTEGGTTLDYVQQTNGRLGWAGIYPGYTLQAVEKQTGQSLTPYPDGYPACGSLSAQLTLRDRKVTLQLDSSGAATIVRSISVDLPESEYGLGTPGMAQTIESRFPKLGLIWSDGNDVELATPDHQAVLIKNGKEHFLDVTHSSCID